jgi:alkanesulfonate monooxygenase SsuD/methylene tetrahydromethanopterin reductase-like flavin-dependent oxidoreductase (luciferase family)
MEFGVFLNQYYPPENATGPGASFEVEDLLDQAELMEDVGFDSVTIGERHIHEEGCVEPVTALAALADRTDSLTLASMAMLPILYHPLHLAEQVAMIDRLSDGRMAFGAALGYRDRELEPFGVGTEGRGKRFIESLELLKRLWSEERVTHDGEHYSLDDVVVSPRPADDLPVWVGGHADVAIKRAAYRSNGWIASASSTTADLERQIGVYEDALDEFGMDRADNDVILMRDCFVDDSLEAARDTIEPYLLTLYEWYSRWGQTYLDEHEATVDYDELEEKFVIGTPADCAEPLRTYEDLGVDHVVLRVQFPGQPQEPTLRCLERLGEEVIPEFQP